MTRSRKGPFFPQLALDRLKTYGLNEEQALSCDVSYMENAQEICSHYMRLPALLFRYRDLDDKLISVDEFHRVRYLTTPSDGFNAQVDSHAWRKYDQPPGSLNRVYLPRIMRHLEGESRMRTWRHVSEDSNIQLFITEGEGKSLCACSVYGLPTLALGGVDMLASRPKGVSSLPPLEDFVWAKRVVTPVFDTDSPMGLKDSVAGALQRLMNWLLARGAIPRLCVLPCLEPSGKTGLDDFLLTQGVEKLLAHIASHSIVHGTASRLLDLRQRYVFVPSHDCFVPLDEAHTRVVPIPAKLLDRHLHLEKIAYPVLANSRKANDLPVMRMDAVPISEALISWAGAKNASRMIYRPGAGKLVEEGDELLVNLWTGWRAEYLGAKALVKLPPQEIREHMLGEYFWLLDNVFQDEPVMREFVEHFLFYPLKFPGAKLAQYMFVVSKLQGIGKDLIAKILLEFVYGVHGRHLRQSDIGGDNSRFNYCDYAVSFLWGDELVVGGARKFYEHLKSAVTDTSLTVERKGLHPIEFDENHINYYLTANAFSFGTAGLERREASHRPGKSSIRDEHRLTAIYRMFQEHGGAPLLWHAREKYSEQGYAPQGDAPATNTKLSYREGVGDVLNVWLEDLLESRDLSRPYFGYLELFVLFRLENPEIQEHRYDAGTLPNRMANCGFRRLFSGNQLYVEFKNQIYGSSGVRRVRVWSYLDERDLNFSRQEILEGLETPLERAHKVVRLNPKKGIL